MIKRIEFGIPPAAGQSPQVLDTPHLTIFVGPNHSGKTWALNELRGGFIESDHVGTIVRRVEHEDLSAQEYVALAKHYGAVRDDGRIHLAKGPAGPGLVTSTDAIERDPQEPTFQRTIRELSTVALDGEHRLMLSQGEAFRWRSPSGQRPGTWTSLYQNPSAFRLFARWVYEAFRQHVALDIVSQPGHILPKISKQPVPEHLLQAVNEEAYRFFSGLPGLGDMSDGFKAYSGVVATLISDEARMIAIDEPDAFLHPPLARSLGKLVARLAADRHAHVFAATHSSHFIFGALSSGADVAIVRLTYDGRSGTARCLDADTLANLMRDPNLRATGVLDALFHEAVSVCEGHSDRVLYDEINTILNRSGRGIRDCLFLNAGGWQNVDRLIRPLRELGIRAAAVIDLDTLGREDFSTLMRGAGVPDASIAGFRQIGATIARQAKNDGQKLRDGVRGIGSLAAAATGLVVAMRQYGIFLVPVGVLEHWLSETGESVNKSEWVPEMLRRLQSVEPSNDDVWKFVDEIAAWVESPAGGRIE